MSIIKKLLNPINIAIFVVMLIVSIIAHLYVGHCQTTKWHYLVQRYYCPSWYKPDLEFKNRDYKRWRVWNENGQLVSSLNIAENGDVSYKSWYANGQMKADYFATKDICIGDRFEGNESYCFALLNDKFGLIDGRKIFKSWHNNGIKEISFLATNVEFKLWAWDDKGTALIMIKEYADKQNNLSKIWNDEGRLKNESFFNKNFNQREQYSYYDSGLLLSYSIFKGDLVVSYCYHKNGVMSSYGKNNRMDGNAKLLISIDKMWYPNSQIKYSLKKKKGYMKILNFKSELLDKSEMIELINVFISSYSLNSYVSDSIKRNSKSKAIDITSYIKSYINDPVYNYMRKDLECFRSAKIKGNELIIKLSSYDFETSNTAEFVLLGFDEKTIKRLRSNDIKETVTVKLFQQCTLPSNKNGEFDLVESYEYLDGVNKYYKENGDINYIQTNNNYGIIEKVDIYEKGNIIKTIRFDQ